MPIQSEKKPEPANQVQKKSPVHVLEANVAKSSKCFCNPPLSHENDNEHPLKGPCPTD